MKDVFKNKRLWIGIVCAVLAVVLIVGVILMAGGNSNTNSTVPSNTTPSGNATEPSGTEPNGTEPNIPEYTGPEDPDEPIVPDDFDPDAGPTPIDPDAPPVVDPDPTPSDPVEPDDGTDDGPEIIPTTPNDTPIETRPPSTEYDFTGITPGNLKAEDWKSWDAEQRQAFVDTYDIGNLSLDDKYNFYSIIQFGGLYDCGHKGHYCPNAECHDYVMTLVAEGCPHCGGNDCAAFYARDELGFTEVNYDQCPQYDITKDPVEYCQECGLKSGKGGCIQLISGGNCPHCGEKIPAMTCHHCDD